MVAAFLWIIYKSHYSLFKAMLYHEKATKLITPNLKLFASRLLEITYFLRQYNKHDCSFRGKQLPKNKAILGNFIFYDVDCIIIWNSCSNFLIELNALIYIYGILQRFLNRWIMVNIMSIKLLYNISYVLKQWIHSFLIR